MNRFALSPEADGKAGPQCSGLKVTSLICAFPSEGFRGSGVQGFMGSGFVPSMSDETEMCKV